MENINSSSETLLPLTSLSFLPVLSIHSEIQDLEDFPARLLARVLARVLGIEHLSCRDPPIILPLSKFQIKVNTNLYKKNLKKWKKKSSCCLLSCRVKVLKIYGYRGSCRELRQMRHFMENMSSLEVMKVKVQVDQQDNFLKLLPITSSKCKIQFI